MWPDLPCYNTSWLNFKDHSPPFESPGCLLPHHVDGEEEAPQCLLMQSLHNHCLLVRDTPGTGWCPELPVLPNVWEMLCVQGTGCRPRARARQGTCHALMPLV